MSGRVMAVTSSRVASVVSGSVMSRVGSAVMSRLVVVRYVLSSRGSRVESGRALSVAHGLVPSSRGLAVE